MLLSLAGMIFAAAGYLVPVAGAISQEIIDVLAVLNALRAALPPKVISDMAELPSNIKNKEVKNESSDAVTQEGQRRRPKRCAKKRG